MIKPKQELSVVRQCKLLDIHRSSVYHRPRPSSPINLALMREINEIHLNRPFLGVRRVTDELCENGYEIYHTRIHRLMQIMGFEAIYPKPV
jgi:putative transposase